MPAFVTHSIFGSEVIPQLEDQTLQTLLKQQYAAYAWGLQGPDLLFFRKALRIGGKSPIAKIGNLMHSRRTPQLLREMGEYVRSRRSCGDYHCVLAYTMGFLCHYALDSAAHPYVYALQNRRARSAPPNQAAGIHHEIENQIDSELHFLKRKKSVNQFRVTDELVIDPALVQGISRMLGTVLFRVYGIRWPVSELERCFPDAQSITSALIDPTGFLMFWCARAVELITCKPKSLTVFVKRGRAVPEDDILNLYRHVWQPPTAAAPPRKESFLQLFLMAEQDAKYLMNELFHAVQERRPFCPVCTTSFDGKPIGKAGAQSYEAAT